MIKNTLKMAVVGLSLLTAASASAMTFDWSGGYRLEWINLTNPGLGTPNNGKSYVLNHLYLSPKIVGSDGFNIVSRFDLLGAGQNSQNSQLGLLWGNTSNSSDADPSTSGADDFKLTQLYMRLDQEYGQIIVGRSPLEFGLGMTYSAGTGLFDHWYTIRDLAAYKFVINDWFIMPILSRSGESSVGTGGSANSLGFMLQYDNPDTRSTIGIFQDTKKGAVGVNDLNDDYSAAYPSNTVATGFELQRTNVVFARGWDSFAFKMEAGFVSGSTGLRTSGGDKIDINAYGLAVEMDLPRPESKWNWSAKLGLASGDDPSSASYEGYHFNPNYNVGMLLFNQRLGQADFLTSSPARVNTVTNQNAFDDEVVSNTMFVAPSALYKWSDKTTIRTTAVYAQILNSQKNSLSSAKDLGLELDIEVIHQPTKTLQWVNQFGILLPGEAWKNGPNGTAYSNDLGYGFVSKAAISF